MTKEFAGKGNFADGGPAGQEIGKGDGNDYEILEGYIADLEREYGLVIPAALKERQREMEKYAKEHNRDARVIYEAFFQFYHLCRKEKQPNELPELSPPDLGVGLAASLLHDIGKSGPAKASPLVRKIAARLYNLDESIIGKNTPIQEALALLTRRSGKEEAAEIKAGELEMAFFGLRPTDLMRKFFRGHTVWSNELLTKNLDQQNPLYRRITKIASSHHYLEGDNPEKIDFQATGLSEEEKKDLFLIKLLIALDQYQACRLRRRNKSTEAREYLTAKLRERGLEKDNDFAAILKLLEKLEKTTAVFNLGVTIDAEVKK